jgi:dolichyl-phosphate-mannose--protein O-mannosyl transferase
MNERKVAYAVLLASVVFLVALRFWFMRANSATIDEFVHIESGYRYWQCADYGVSPENPPLAKLVAAFPVRGWQLSGFLSACGTQVTPSRGPDYFVAIKWLLSPNGPALLWQARAGMIVFPLALLVLVFFATRSFFGSQTAAIAAVLLVFEPTLIAHGSLATIDIAFATCMFAGVWAAYEYASKPSLPRLLLLGLAMGLALASKFLALSLPWIVLLVLLTEPASQIRVLETATDVDVSKMDEEGVSLLLDKLEIRKKDF